MQNQAPQMITIIDPYVYQTLQTVIGKDLVIQTVRDTTRGKLTDVKPDHIVLKTNGDSIFFIRIQQIVSIMPDDD
ncbi:YuzF family protein [Metabacillus sp. 84]|uniref:YuzF family protein n=1 Tax=unclassified Metabacillus TaxID=2675274 RepID=UPI003CF3623C